MAGRNGHDVWSEVRSELTWIIWLGILSSSYCRYWNDLYRPRVSLGSACPKCGILYSLVIHLPTVTTHNWRVLARIVIACTIAGLTVWYTVVSVLHNVHPLDAANLGLIAIAVICIVLLGYPQTFAGFTPFKS